MRALHNSRSFILFSSIAHRGSKPRFAAWRAIVRSVHLKCMADLSGDTFFLDEFAFRQFDGGHAAQINIPKAEVVRRVHQLYAEVSTALATNCKVKATFLSLLPSTAYRHLPSAGSSSGRRLCTLLQALLCAQFHGRNSECPTYNRRQQAPAGVSVQQQTS